MAVTFDDLWRRALAGTLTDRSVSINLGRNNITALEAQALRGVVSGSMTPTEALNILATAGAGAPAAPAGAAAALGFQVRTLEVFAEEIRSNRITDGEGVDIAWGYVVGLRDVCGRWPRDKEKVTEALDPFGLRVLRYIYNRRFDALGAAEGVRILGLCSYKDLREVAEQGAHEKRVRQLDGSFDDGTLSKSDVGDACKRGLGIPVTKLGGYVLTSLLKQHYNRKAYMVSSFDALEEDLIGLISRGKLESEEVRKLQKSGKLLQVDSPEAWEQSPEEQRLQKLLGAEYWYLGSETPLEDEEFAVMAAHHKCVQEDGSKLPGPRQGDLIDLLAGRLSGDGVAVTADDLWSHFKGGRPAPNAPLPQRPRSVFHSRKLAAHFAGRLGLSAEVVERNMTRHHDLADEIAASQGAIRRFFGLAEDLLKDKQEIPFGIDSRIAGALLTGGTGFVVGFVLANFAGWPGEKAQSLFLAVGLAILGAVFGSRLNVEFGLLEVTWTLLLVLLGACSSFVTIGGVEHDVSAEVITQAEAASKITMMILQGGVGFIAVWLAGILLLRWMRGRA